MSEVTRILNQIESGDPSSARLLLPLVYDELRKLATVRLAQEKSGQTLQATALVHEAYLRLVGNEQESGRNGAVSWNSRGHFFGAAAEAMRRIVVEHARSRGRIKRGGQMRRVDLDSKCAIQTSPSPNILDLDEALTRLAAIEPVKAELVKLRFFAGLTMPQAAEALGISLATAQRYWTFAKAWLYSEVVDLPTTDL